MTNCKVINTDALVTDKVQLDKEQQLAALAKAIAHPARVRILNILFTLDNLGGCLNSDLVSELGLAQSTVSEHLRILKLAGFIEAQSLPPKMCYRINRDAYSHFLTLAQGLLHE
ncbi:ArsR/SmtB family transcription factor [Vibrio renipiscarius]|uniref:Transcriptional regulator n=1 Tax=Vibrio renipiscarius TaxID=1461322 RepID=A0A0C2K6V9_9VIBR|nr:winged helix-turn-helix domain-containing protein [Vibrio renipiscarius]KII76722.1 transcriptional regulator [Vibrio renipiscarius]KII77758.1 transcriptional regulator [Vibrio renipiscarius]